jgi:hypothetical protein
MLADQPHLCSRCHPTSRPLFGNSPAKQCRAGIATDRAKVSFQFFTTGFPHQQRDPMIIGDVPVASKLCSRRRTV